MTTTEETIHEKRRIAHLHWASSNGNTTNNVCCFGKPHIEFNLDTLRPSPLTMGAIFGIRDESLIRIILLAEKEPNDDESRGLDVISHHVTNDDNDDDDYIELDDSKTWPLCPDAHYLVKVVMPAKNNDDDCESSKLPTVPIDQLHDFVGGCDQVHALSNAFYGRIWNNDGPENFTKLFVNRLSSASIQAHRQFTWFCEIWGGESLYSSAQQRNQYLVPRVMQQHSPRRMSLAHGLTWLKLMNAAVQDAFGTDPNYNEIAFHLGLYWLHFYGFFPYSDEERAALKQEVFAHLDKEIH